MTRADNRGRRAGAPRALSECKEGWWLLAVTASAALVRLLGISWGLPDPHHFFSYHPDEFSTAGTVMGMLNTGDLNPHFFHYGSLSIYLTLLLAWPGHVFGWVQTVAETHLVGRALTVALGTGTIPLVFLLVRKLDDGRHALLAAACLAWMPGHALHSQFATVDVPATFFVTAALLFAVYAWETPQPKWLLLAGAAAGLAAATKYNAGLVLLAPFLAALKPGRGSRGSGVALTVGACVAAFLLTTPFAVLDFPAFASDVSYELFEHPREGHLNIFERTGNGWWYHSRANLPYVTGLPLLLLAIAGGVSTLRRRRAVDLLLLAFALPYFLGLGFSQVRFLRYTLLLTPVLATLAARGVGGRTVPKALGTVATLLLFVSLAVLTGRQQLSLVGADPRDRAARWMESHAAPGTTVGLLNPPWFYTPPLIPWNGGPESRHRFEALLAQPGGRFRFRLFEDWDEERLRRECPDYFLMSEFEWREEVRLQEAKALSFLTTLESTYRRVAEFEGIPPPERWMFGGFAPHDWLYPFATVRIYARK